jgi:hypothetical protein
LRYRDDPTNLRTLKKVCLPTSVYGHLGDYFLIQQGADIGRLRIDQRQGKSRKGQFLVKKAIENFFLTIAELIVTTDIAFSDYK